MHFLGETGLDGTLLAVRRGPLALWFAAIVIGAALLGALVARGFSEPLNRRWR